MDSNKTVILDKTAVLVVTKGIYSAMKIIPKDCFGNKSTIEETAVRIEIRKVREVRLPLIASTNFSILVIWCFIVHFHKI